MPATPCPGIWTERLDRTSGQNVRIESDRQRPAATGSDRQ